MHKQLVKIWKKNMWVIFQHFQSMIWKKRENTNLFFGIKTFNNSQKTTIYTQKAEKPLALFKRDSNTDVSSMKFPRFLRTAFLIEHLQWQLLTYDKSFFFVYCKFCLEAENNRVKTWSKNTEKRLIRQNFIIFFVYAKIGFAVPKDFSFT